MFEQIGNFWDRLHVFHLLLTDLLAREAEGASNNRIGCLPNKLLRRVFFHNDAQQCLSSDHLQSEMQM